MSSNVFKTIADETKYAQDCMLLLALSVKGNVIRLIRLTTQYITK